MSAHKSQCERIIEVLERDGEISRNQCLSMYPAITRLSARIDDLERKGWKFAVEDYGSDYYYKLIAAPAPEQLALV